MYGYGRGRGSGWWDRPVIDAPTGHRYVGPCRCGFGPNAYYQDERGRLYHARHFHRLGVPTVSETAVTQAELDDLKREKANLEKQIRELEERLDKEAQQ
jgi:hypothetical protein